MRRILTLVVLFVGLGAIASCAEPASAPPAAPAPAVSPNPGAAPPSADQVPQETESIYAGMFSPVQACRTADQTYAELDETWQEHIRNGTAAERRGDKEGVAKALAGLEPLLSSTAGTLADAAAKVADPVLREALNSLSDAAAESTLFTTFAEFQSLEARNAPAETTLKRECPKHGYSLKNIA
jgi:hypothetical protein